MIKPYILQQNMLYLLLAIVSSALVSITLRLGKQKVANNMGMFVVNYVVCMMLSFLLMESNQPFTRGLSTELVLGILSGVLYLVNFVLLQRNITKNGVVMSALFMKLGVLIPTLMAIVVFHEQPRLLQVVGIVLSVTAIIITQYEKGAATEVQKSEGSSFRFLLVILLIASGLTDAMANIYDKLGSIELKDHYLVFTFAAAAACAFILYLRGDRKLCIWDILFGVLVAVPNYFSSRFLILSLHQIAAVVVYPVYSVTTIVAISMTGVLLFREKLNSRKLWAMGLIIVSLVLLNIG